MKKVVLLLIAACMVVTCFACGGNNGKKPIDPGSISTEDKWDQLPDTDAYSGTDFRVSTRGSYGAMEIVVDDELSENIVDLALMLRNAKVEDRYGVFIERQDNDGTAYAHTNSVLNACTMQADTFDLAMTYVYESAPLITNGFVLNWNELKYTKLAQSHWINGMNDEFAVRDAIYTAVSKMCISILGQTVAMYYNRDLGDSWKGEDFSAELVETINNGDWTYEALMNIVNEFGWRDATGDGKTADDTYGFYMTDDWSIDTWHAAWEVPIINNTVENGLEDVYMSEKLRSFVDRMHTMYYDTNGIFFGKQGDANAAFISDRALFITNSLNASISYYPANMESTYTIIPQPKYDENQENYRSAMFDNYSVMSIPITADANFVSLIVEALSVASEAHIYPAYRHDALQGQSVSDVDSIAMLDIVMESSSWDIGTLLFADGVPYMDMVRRDVQANPGNTQIQQSYEAVAEDVEEKLQEIMEKFDEFREN